MMDRRSFLGSMAALGVVPFVDVERLVAAPEDVEPIEVRAHTVPYIELRPYALTVRCDCVDVTSWDEPCRMYRAGLRYVDVELYHEDGQKLAGRLGERLVVQFTCEGFWWPVVLTRLSCDVEFARTSWRATLVVA